MRRLLTEKLLLKKLTPKDLDDYLSKAWYRLGATIFTTQFLFLDNSLYSPVWIRLPLKDYQFRKRLRKIWRKNHAEFTIDIQPINLNQEKEALFQKYKKSFKGRLSPRMQNYLYDDQTSAPFQTYETTIRYEGKLIAYSFFDIGKDSMASISGIYDPDYQQYSLGFFTMLLEIDYAQRHDFKFYYPGYIVPDYPKFDYKLSIGKPEELEYYSICDEIWKPYSDISEQEVPVQTLYRAYSQICQSLNNMGIQAEVLFYPAYEPQIIKYYQLKKIDAPLFISCFSDFFVQPHIMVFYDFLEKCFYLYQSKKMSFTQMNWESSATPDTQTGVLMEFLKDRVLILKTSSQVQILLALKALNKELQRTVFPRFWDGFPF